MFGRRFRGGAVYTDGMYYSDPVLTEPAIESGDELVPPTPVPQSTSSPSLDNSARLLPNLRLFAVGLEN